MSHPPPPQPPGPEDPSCDPVWALLDRARTVPPAPHFTRRVMAALQAEHSAQPARWTWLHRILAPSLRPAFAIAILALLLAGVWQLQSRPSRHHDTAATTATTAAAPVDDADEIFQALASELALLDDVDHLLDPEDGLDLEEEDVRRLLF